jgi:hypothetical protein
MERLPLTNNYISTKVGSTTTKNGEKYGQNRMGGKGRRAGWRGKKNEMGGAAPLNIVYFYVVSYNVHHGKVEFCDHLDPWCFGAPQKFSVLVAHAHRCTT